MFKPTSSKTTRLTEYQFNKNKKNKKSNPTKINQNFSYNGNQFFYDVKILKKEEKEEKEEEGFLYLNDGIDDGLVGTLQWEATSTTFFINKEKKGKTLEKGNIEQISDLNIQEKLNIKRIQVYRPPNLHADELPTSKQQEKLEEYRKKYNVFNQKNIVVTFE